MKQLLVLLLLSPGLMFGQARASGTPRMPIIQTQKGTGTATFDFPGISGTTLIAISQWYSSASGPVVSDVGAGGAHRCSSWTQLLAPFLDTGSDPKRISIYGCASSTAVASDVVTFSVSGASFQTTAILEIPALWGITLDVTATASYTGNPGTVDCPNVTTTVNGDLLICAADGDHDGGWGSMQGTAWLQYMVSNGHDSLSTALSEGGTSGVQTGGTFTSYAMDNGGIVTIALKPTTNISITSDAVAPDGGLSTTYAWSLQAIGGSGAYTYACTGVPSGLTLNTSTGAITGTPLASNNFTLSCTVTDGTLTSTPKSIALKIGGTMSSISLSQSKNSITQSATFDSNVTAGQVLVVSNGWQALSGPFPFPSYCTDTLGTVYSLINFNKMTLNSTGDSAGQLWAGTAPSSGADTVTCSLVIYAITAWNNITYAAADNTLFTTGTTASPATVTSGNFTPLVPNMLMYAQGICYTASCTMTPQAPLTTLDTAARPLSSAYLGLTTVTTYTASFAEANNTSGIWGISLTGFRPSAGAITPSGAPLWVIQP